jgi:Leucine-rich repeat (LRR) protein
MMKCICKTIVKVLIFFRISEISDFCGTNYFHNLTELNLNGNPLGDWSNVMRFAHLPNLQTIYINSCNIKSISVSAFMSLAQNRGKGRGLSTSWEREGSKKLFLFFGPVNLDLFA